MIKSYDIEEFVNKYPLTSMMIYFVCTDDNYGYTYLSSNDHVVHFSILHLRRITNSSEFINDINNNSLFILNKLLLIHGYNDYKEKYKVSNELIDEFSKVNKESDLDIILQSQTLDGNGISFYTFRFDSESLEFFIDNIDLNEFIRCVKIYIMELKLSKER